MRAKEALLQTAPEPRKTNSLKAKISTNPRQKSSSFGLTPRTEKRRGFRK
jgi:hypothetical protein